MKRILNYFFQGLLFVVPIVATFWVLINAILRIDNLLPFKISVTVPWLERVNIPGLGLLAIFIFITIVGYFGSRYISNPFFSLMEHAIEHTPLIKVVYSSVRDLIKAFVGEKKSFNKPVLVKLTKKTKTQRVCFV